MRPAAGPPALLLPPSSSDFPGCDFGFGFIPRFSLRVGKEPLKKVSGPEGPYTKFPFDSFDYARRRRPTMAR